MIVANERSFVQSLPLSEKHFIDATQRRGLPHRWVEVNSASLDAAQASVRLGYPAKSGGIWLEGCNRQGQFRPDKPWKGEKDRKAPKYRTGRGAYDAMLPTCPDASDYWDDLEALRQRCYQVDGRPCLVLTEGMYKAIAGCAIGVPTIGLLGVEMGLTPKDDDPQGRRYLVPTLERFASEGFGFIVAFDADAATNKSVRQAERTLLYQLKLFGLPLYSATGQWTVEEGKGMDDYIQNGGGDRFKRDVLGRAISFDAWERQFQATTPPDKAPPADIIGGKMAEEYRNRFLYNDEHKTWMEYELDHPGVWGPVSDSYMESVVDKMLTAKGITGYNSARYVTNVLTKMRHQLHVRLWEERSANEILPFQNGVFNLQSGAFERHAPGHRLTWCLPRLYTLLETGWDTIDAWLTEVARSEDHKRILICFAAAVLRGRADLQKFLHLIGPGGTGKSTYTRLLEELIGPGNCWAGNFRDLEDKHEVARLIGKRLVILSDQDKVTGQMSNFKKLTGQDTLSGRRLYKDSFSLRFPGLAVVTSNGPLFHGDGGSWLTRRVLMLPLEHQPKAVRDMDALFAPELSAFTRYLLSISNEEITATLRQVSAQSLTATLWQAKIRTDSIAAWLNDWVICDPDATLRIGTNKKEWATEPYHPSASTAFGSYAHYSQNAGYQIKSVKNFISDAIELCQRTLGWSVTQDTDAQGRSVLRGIRLRCDGDVSPNIEALLLADPPIPDPPEPEPLPPDEPADNQGSVDSIDEPPAQMVLDLETTSPGQAAPTWRSGQGFGQSSPTRAPASLLHEQEPSQVEAADADAAVRTRREEESMTDDPNQPLNVGDRVYWESCPPHCGWANPFTIVNISGDLVWLDLYANPVLQRELRR
jgi:putative DNA primase/helicase